MNGIAAAVSTTPTLQRQVEQFLYFEAALLDEWRLDEWFALMHHQVKYRVPSPGSDHLDSRNTLQVIHDDHTRLGGRVTRLKSRHAHAESPHSRTRRFVTNVRAEADSDAVTVHANFHVMRTRLGQLDHFLGTYRYVLIPTGDSFLVRERVATLDHGIVEAGGTVSIIL
nr:aromatic-ring-hydroxylating dioxygenase subunit beta [Rhodococcus wratislaviensis]GLK33635.1 benzoate 1,2-dioxygenase small subunit [Rhodococcus wratislaviensis]